MARVERLYDPVLSALTAVWVDTRSKATTIEALITAIGATETTLLVNTAETFVDDDAIPSTLSLVFTPAGSFSVSAGKNLDIQTTSIKAGNHQIFSGAGDFDFADGTVLKTSWFATLEAGLTYIGANDLVTYELTEDYSLTSNDSVTANIRFRINHGAIITITGATLTFDSPAQIDAGATQQIFSSVATTPVSFSKGGIIPVNWFGAVGDYSTDCATARDQVFKSINPAIGGVIYYPSGRYRESTTFEVATVGAVTNGITIQGPGYTRGSTPISQIIQTGTGYAIEFGGGTSGTAAQYFCLKDIAIAQDNATDTYGVNLNWIVDGVMENVEIGSFGTGGLYAENDVVRLNIDGLWTAPVHLDGVANMVDWRYGAIVGDADAIILQVDKGDTVKFTNIDIAGMMSFGAGGGETVLNLTLQIYSEVGNASATPLIDLKAVSGFEVSHCKGSNTIEAANWMVSTGSAARGVVFSNNVDTGGSGWTTIMDFDNFTDTVVMPNLNVGAAKFINFASAVGNSLYDASLTRDTKQNQCGVIGTTGAGVTNGTTAGRAKSVNAVKVFLASKIGSFAALDDAWNLSGLSTGAAEYMKVLLCVDIAGGSTTIVQGEVAASQALALVPPTRSALQIVVGVVEIPNNYSGGSLAGYTFHDVLGTWGFD